MNRDKPAIGYQITIDKSIVRETKSQVRAATIKAGGPKGLEAVILLAQKGVRKFETGFNQIMYGKPSLDKDKNRTTIKTIIKNPLDYGINNVIDEIISIDYCDLINYTLSNIKLKNTFNPKLTKEELSELSFAEQSVWRVKKAAYKIQNIIDGGIEYADKNDLGGVVSEDDPQVNTQNGVFDSFEIKKQKNVFKKIGLIKSEFDELIKIISPELNEISNLTGYSVNSSTLTDLLPQLKAVLPKIEDKIAYLNQWTDYRQIPISEYQKIINTIDKIKVVCIAIQGFDSPAAVLRLLPNSIQKQSQSIIERIQRWLNPAQAIPFLRNLIGTLQKINLIIKNVLSVVNALSFITNVILAFIRAIKILIKFFKLNPIPAATLTLGAISTAEDGKKTFTEIVKNFEKRLSQLAYLFYIIYDVLTAIAIELEVLIGKLRTLIANLETCKRVDPNILADLKDQVTAMESSLDDINRFIKNKSNKTQNSYNRIVGEYTIQIVTEEVIEESFNLNRRYGVALNNKGIVVVSSSPTYASLDSIIVAEVKQNLFSKGLIKNTSLLDYTILEEELINEVKSYLYDDDLNMEIDYNVSDDATLDPPDNENDDVGIGLNAFINKLPGGKALRKRIRRARIQNNNSLVESLKKEDPEGKYTNNIINKTQKETNNLKIEELTAEKNKWKAALALAPTISAKLLAVKKIKDIDEEIKKLKNS
jgi:hypothetical protein